MFNPSLLFGQTPYHYNLGENELEGIDIYDIIQKNDGVFIIATDNGIYTYDGYSFALINHDSGYSRSTFNLISNENGKIYCNNLNGEIFEVLENETKLVHKVPDSLNSSYLSFNFINENKMLIHSIIAYEVDISTQSNPIKQIIPSHLFHQAMSKPKKTKNGELFLQFWKDSIAYISENQVKVKPISLNNTKLQDSISIVDYFQNSQIEYCCNRGKNIYNHVLTKDSVKFINEIQGPSELCRVYSTQDKFWYASHTRGSYYYHLKSKKRSKKIFKDYFISTIYEDHSGNILMGTFDQGIIVIPKNGANTILDNETLEASNFALSQDLDIYLGGSDGNIYSYKNGLIDTVKSIGFKKIEFLEVSKNGQYLFFDIESACILDVHKNNLTQLRGSSLKNISEMNDSTFLLACSNQSQQVVIRSDSIRNRFYFSKRSNAIISLDSLSVLIGTSNGLEVHHHPMLEDVKKLKFENKRILASCIFRNKEEEYLIGTEGFGILTWNRSELKIWNSQIKSEAIHQILKWKNHFIIRDKKGVYLTDSSGNIMKHLSFIDGLLSLTPTKIKIVNNDLYCLHKTGLQKINLPQLLEPTPKITFKTIEFKVNNVLQELNGPLSFKHYENKIDVSIYAPNLSVQKETTYRYKIESIEKDWNYNTYEKNKFTYKTLPPGEYKLKVQVLVNGQVQDSRQINFSIDFPFWQKWWFFLITAIFIAFLVSLFFRWRIKIQKENAERRNELNQSKLAAIKSQMNPHFIFNSLNSIQDLVLKGDIDNSYSSITTFADLVRKTLEYSEKEYVDFEEEIHLLSQYLKLEKLRFKEALSYKIETNNCSDFCIPPMLIQPFVENALLHGLLHKKGAKKLQISFKIEDKTLLCEIIDNGIGRYKSKEIKSRQNKNYDSFSGGATMRRFSILRAVYKQDLGYKYEDIMKENNSNGTKVTIKIPVINPL